MSEKSASLPLEPEFVSTTEAQRLMGLGRTKTFELIADGTVESIKIGKKRLVRLRSIRQLGRAA